MDNTYPHSRNAEFGDFEQNQTQIFSYQQPTKFPEEEHFGGIQLSPKI
jgi:hypothetical protein